LEVPPCPSEAEDKDLLEPNRLKAVANLQEYQDETRVWRDPKVKLRELDIGNLVLLRSPCTESFRKLKSKWVGPYMVVKYSRPGAYNLPYSQGKMLEYSWNEDNLHHFYI
jgi:hypothetical protein